MNYRLLRTKIALTPTKCLHIPFNYVRGLAGADLSLDKVTPVPIIQVQPGNRTMGSSNVSCGITMLSVDNAASPARTRPIQANQRGSLPDKCL
jgi:hypothetical protein